MKRKEGISNRGSTKRKWYDLIGQSGLPIVHPGGAHATRQLLEMCGVNQNKKVFDAGCGTGWTACETARSRGGHVVGIDARLNNVQFENTIRMVTML